MSTPSVLFVSKPIAPPFHDGTKCLVRDVATHLTRFAPRVMSTTRDPVAALGSKGGGVVAHAVYGDSGSFTPAVAANARAAAWLMARGRADIWHFVFAPNSKTSAVGRVAKRFHRVPTVQTVASAPRSFEPELFFGDVIVAQSRWTADRVRGCVPSGSRVEVVPPPLGAFDEPDAERVRWMRARLEVDDTVPLFVYPGDIDLSDGARVTAAAVESIVRAVPGAVVVFACRAKTPRAADARRAIERTVDRRCTRFVGSVDLIALMHVSRAVLFPVDDLFGKVDLPIALLEAMAIGTPVIAPAVGPLADLEGVERMADLTSAALGEAVVSLERDDSRRSRVIREQREAVARIYAADRVADRYESIYDELLSR